MREIPFLWIDGAIGAGKTALVERLLESNRKRQLNVVRLLRSDAVSSTEADKGELGEILRYKTAGAIDQLRLLYPNELMKQNEHAAMEQLRNFAWKDSWGDESACDALICEGQNDFQWRSSLRVFVARTLPKEQSLVSRLKREVVRFSLQELLDLKIFPATDGDEAESIVDKVCEGADLVVPSKKVAEPVKHLLDMATNGMPVYGNFWELHPACKNILKAAVIVINIAGENERPAADKFAAQIRSLRTDPELKRDLSSRRDFQGRLSIYVCNLADPKDKELLKALARIKRPIQEFCPRHNFAPVHV